MPVRKDKVLYLQVYCVTAAHCITMENDFKMHIVKFLVISTYTRLFKQNLIKGVSSERDLTDKIKKVKINTQPFHFGHNK